MKQKYKILLDKYQDGLDKCNSQKEVMRFNEGFRKILNASDIDMEAVSLGAFMFIRHSYKMDDIEMDRRIKSL